MSYRYLLHIGYIGTHFRGIQRNLNAQKYDIKSSVQGSIELALKKFNPINEPKLALSSRTDAGVHALHTSVHVDLETSWGKPYPASRVTLKLNQFFYQQNLQIRVHKTEIVPDTFHARYSAKNRTYLYRLAIPKHELPPGEQKIFPVAIEECDRCYFVLHPSFDIDLARQAADLIKGRHDFRSFMGADQQNSEQDHPFFALREIDSITIEPGHSACTAFNKPWSEEKYSYWNIQISGRSFLNRQVRRIVAVILGVAQQRITCRDVYELVTIPSKNSWCPKIAVAPAHGLYLCRIDYDNKDKEFPNIEPIGDANQVNLIENELP